MFVTFEKNIKIVTFVSNESEIANFNAARNMIANSNHKHSANYSEGFNISQIVAFTNGYVNNELEMCSSISRNPDWPIGVYRILNRLFKPFVDERFTKTIEPIWVEMISNQIEYCKNNLLDFNTAIITRKIGYKNSLAGLQDKMIEKNYTFKLWKDSAWVCSDKKNQGCLQDVMSFGSYLTEELF